MFVQTLLILPLVLVSFTQVMAASDNCNAQFVTDYFLKRECITERNEEKCVQLAMSSLQNGVSASGAAIAVGAIVVRSKGPVGDYFESAQKLADQTAKIAKDLHVRGMALLQAVEERSRDSVLREQYGRNYQNRPFITHADESKIRLRTIEALSRTSVQPSSDVQKVALHLARTRDSQREFIRKAVTERLLQTVAEPEIRESQFLSEQSRDLNRQIDRLKQQGPRVDQQDWKLAQADNPETNRDEWRNSRIQAHEAEMAALKKKATQAAREVASFHDNSVMRVIDQAVDQSIQRPVDESAAKVPKQTRLAIGEYFRTGLPRLQRSSVQSLTRARGQGQGKPSSPQVRPWQ